MESPQPLKRGSYKRYLRDASKVEIEETKASRTELVTNMMSMAGVRYSCRMLGYGREIERTISGFCVPDSIKVKSPIKSKKQCVET